MFSEKHIQNSAQKNTHISVSVLETTQEWDSFFLPPIPQFNATCGQWWQLRSPQGKIFVEWKLFRGNHWHVAENGMPKATPSSILSWLETVINQNAEQQLALCWHSVCIQQLIQEIGQMMYNVFDCLAKCICYQQHLEAVSKFCFFQAYCKLYYTID